MSADDAAHTPRRAYRGRLLTATDAGETSFFADGLLVVEGRRITSVGQYTSEARAAFAGPVTDLRPYVLLPGFVDTHVHFPQTRVIGSASGPLLDWLDQTVFPEEARFRDEAYARAVAADFTGRLLAAGTTTSAVFSSSSPSATNVLFEALDTAGLRAVAGLTLMDQSCPEALSVGREAAIAACEVLISQWHGHDDHRLGFAVTPRFALSCSRALLEDAGRLAEKHDLVIQTHIAENAAEGAAVLAAHPYAKDYLGTYESTGLLTRRTVLAHAIHLSPSEWDRVAARGAKVAHCPDSNFFLGSGRMRLAEARSHGVMVGLGSDVAAGRSFNLRRATASAYDNALCLGNRLRPAELLAMATLDGARTLGMDTVTGSLEPGKDADFVALRLPDYVETEADVLGHLVFGDAGGVERVYIRGRLVHAVQ